MRKRFITFLVLAMALAVPTYFALAQGGDFENPLGYDTVEEFLTAVLQRLQSIIAVLALIFIVVGGIMYITSGGNSGRIETAKKTVTFALIGLAIAIAAPSFLKEISIILEWDADLGDAADALTLSQIALNVLKFLIGVIGVLSLIMLVVGGTMYVSSAGDEQKSENAKKTVTYAIIGLVVAVSSLIIVTQITNIIMG